MKVKCQCFLILQDTAILMKKGFVFQRMFFMTSGKGWEINISDTTPSNVHNPKIIRLFQHFIMQTIENISDTARWFHTSTLATAVVVQSKICFSGNIRW